jgi:hypothetical protein
MDAHEHPACSCRSIHDCCGVPSLVDLYRGQRKDVWVDPAMQLTSPVHLLGSFHLRHFLWVAETLDHLSLRNSGLCCHRHRCCYFRHSVGKTKGHTCGRYHFGKVLSTSIKTAFCFITCVRPFLISALACRNLKSLYLSQDCWCVDFDAPVIRTCTLLQLQTYPNGITPSRLHAISTSLSPVRLSGPSDKCYHL